MEKYSESIALRQELLFRITFQNIQLLISVALFMAFCALAASYPAHVGMLCFGSVTAIFAMSLQWCHHGVRTMQIKRYLMLGDQKHGWEEWLPRNRPKTLLGTRWLVSTKGVFLGLQLATMLVGLTDGTTLFLGLSAFVIAGTAAFLFTNPKE